MSAGSAIALSLSLLIYKLGMKPPVPKGFWSEINNTWQNVLQGINAIEIKEFNYDWYSQTLTC